MLLRTRINLGTFGAIFLVGISIVIVDQFTFSNVEQQRTETAVTMQRNLFEKNVISVRERFVPSFSALTRSRDLKKALKKSDQVNLKEEIVATYNRLSTSKAIDFLQITDAKGQVLSSLPKPFAGKTTQATVSQAIKNKKLTGGLIVDDFGRIVISAAMPLVSRGKLLGVGVFSKTLDDALNDYKDGAGMDIFVINQAAEISSGTNDELWQRLKVDLSVSENVPRGDVDIDGVIYEWVKQPIIGLSGQMLGSLLTAKDITYTYNAQVLLKRIMYSALVAFLFVLAIVFTIYLRRNFRPLSDIVMVLEALNKGDHNVQVNEHPHKDEIGAITDAVKQFQTTLIKMDDMAEKEKHEQHIRSQTAQTRNGLTKNFNTGVSDVLEKVIIAVEKMENSSVEMSEMAEKGTDQAGTVLGASKMTAENVQTVASAAEELSSAITEISQQMRHANEVAEKASTDAEMTEAIINELSAVAREIGGVIELINDIAEQTNLLALNATIEAARAGDAGKGFAVVASEVKSLAGQTTKATDDIGVQVTNVQEATEKAVTSIAEIATTIKELNEVSTAVSAAVEQQGAATQEIARNIEQARVSTGEVRENIGDVKTFSERTGILASGVKVSSADVAGMSHELRQTIEKFFSDFEKA